MKDGISTRQIHMQPEQVRGPDNRRNQKYDLDQARDDTGDIAEPCGGHSHRQANQCSVCYQQQKSRYRIQGDGPGPDLKIQHQSDIDRKIMSEENYLAQHEPAYVERIGQPDLLDVTL